MFAAVRMGWCTTGVNELREPPNLPSERGLLTPAFLRYSAGFILFGFGVWGSGALPKWAGTLLALHAPLLTAPIPDLFSVLGALLLVTGGGWITFTDLRRPPFREAGAGPELRESEL